jgi:capsule polysaccharide export protein KpsE/RkpR
MSAHSGEHVALPSSAGWSISDIFLMIGQERKVFAVCLFVCLCVLGYQLRPAGKSYAASALIMPPQQSQGSVAGALAQLGAIAGMAGVSSSVKTPEETYQALFGTRRVQDEVIEKNGLLVHFNAKTKTDARRFLNDRTKVTVDKKTGMLTIQVTESSPDMAAKLANAHVSALQKLLSSVAVSEVQQRRQFLEKQVEKTKEKLIAADENFKSEQRSGGLVLTQVLAESSMGFPLTCDPKSPDWKFS